MTVSPFSPRRLTALALFLPLALACAGAPPAPRPSRPASAPAAPPPPASIGTRERLERGGPPPGRYFPLAVGNEWTYSVAGSASSGRQETIRIVGRDGPWFLDDHRTRLRIEADGVRDKERYLLRAPLAVGASWTAVDNLVVQKFELIDVDLTIVTPAGRFEHCVTVRNDQPLPGGARFVTEWTYAPGVGLVALRTYTSAEGKHREQTSLTLVSYRLEPQAAEK